MKKLSAPKGFPSKSAGFTLIEIMIVVLIIGVLAAIAMTSYQGSVIRSRRAAAASCLQENAQLMERFRTTTMSYVDAPDPTCSAEVDMFYEVNWNGAAPTATEFSIAATPEGAQEKDTDCGILTIDQRGVRGSEGSEQECW